MKLNDYGKKNKMRAVIAVSLVISLLGVLSLRLAWLQFYRGKELSDKAIAQQTRDKVVNSKRGIIYDRNGKILAQSSTVSTVTVTPNEVRSNKDVNKVAERVASVLEMDKDKVLKIFNRKTAYEIVKKKVEAEKVNKLREMKIKGIHFDEDSKRYYPYGTIAAHVIGFVGDDNQGLQGVELVYDKNLKGVPGRMVTANDAAGSEMPYKYEKYINAENGSNIVLTIDEVIQQFVESELEQAVKDYNVTNGASCIIMNAKTGEILAMATYPTYDLNAPMSIVDEQSKAEVDKLEGEEKSKAISDILNKQWRNKAVVDTYEPGSTFKSFVASMALEENVVSLNEVFFCSGSHKVGDKSINCWKTGGHGSETFVQGVQNSCNPVFMTIGARIGTANFYKYYKAFGFAEKTGFDLPGEAVGAFHKMSKFNEVELATCSFGQSFNVTPLQMITAYSAITNNGAMVRPHIVKEFTDDNGKVIKSFDTEVIRNVISPETAQTVRNILESVVSEGTSKNAYIKGYRVAGKTGTSEKVPRNQGKYVASFCGFAPANDPEVIGIVMLDEPMGDSHMGGQIAAPTFKNIFDNVLRYLGIEPQYTEEELATMDNTVPNVEGIERAKIAAAFDGSGFKYNIIGKGKTVISQIPKGGASLPEGSTVMLYTEDDKSEKVKVPNVVGMTASQANAALAEKGLNMKIYGNEELSKNNAVVNKQEPAAETDVTRGSVVSVQFSYSDVH